MDCQQKLILASVTSKLSQVRLESLLLWAVSGLEFSLRPWVSVDYQDPHPNHVKLIRAISTTDSTMMATLTTPIANSYHSFSILSWIASSYLIATAAVQPLTGRLTDIFGRKTGLLVCTTLFGLGNLACGLAQQGWVMILGRIISGAGGGGLFAIQTMVATDLVPLRKRGMWQGLGNIVFGAGGALGGAFGGLINQLMGWRMAFLIQVPFVLVSFILIIVVVRLPAPAPHAKSPWSRIDFGGAILLMSALILLLFALNNAGNVVPWTHPLVLTTFPLSVVLLVLFVIVEEKVAVEPIIRVRLFLNRTVTMACLTNWFTMMAMYALFFYAPIYFQLRGLSSSQRGAELISQGVGAAIGALAVGFLLKRTGRYYIINLLFSGMFVASTALLCTFDLGTPAYEPPIVLFVFGLGYGGMFVVALLALIAAIDHSEQAIATAAAYVFRSTGTSIGVTIASSVSIWLFPSSSRID